MAKKVKKKETQVNNDASNEKLCAILSYLLIGIIWYFADDKMRQSSFVKYHAKQGIVLILAEVLYSLVLSILFSILFIPLMFGGFLFGIMQIYRILQIIPLIFVIVGIVNAANGKEKELPLIGKYAEKLTF